MHSIQYDQTVSIIYLSIKESDSIPLKSVNIVKNCNVILEKNVRVSKFDRYYGNSIG